MTFDVSPYTVTLEGLSVTIHLEGNLYAMGTWDPMGGYVRYLYDRPDGTYSWPLFDRVDNELRNRTAFKPTPVNPEQ